MDSPIKQRKKMFWDEKFNNVSFSFLKSDKTLRANKSMLALVSPVFEKMFFGSLAEKQDPIPIVDIDIQTFSLFLR